MKKLSRTRLFLLEMLVNLLVFIIGAAVCLTTLSEAYSLSASSVVITNAHQTLENTAMTFRSVNGDLNEFCIALNGIFTDSNTIKVWYDKSFNPVSEDLGIYYLKANIKESENNVINAKFTIYYSNDKAIEKLSVSQYKNPNIQPEHN